MSSRPDIRPARVSAVQEALGVWGLSFVAIIAASLAGKPAIAKLVATAAFLYLPLWAMRARGEDFRDYGLSLSRWRQDLALALGICAVVLPVFFAGFVVFGQLLPKIPPEWRDVITPLGGTFRYRPRLPHRPLEWLIDQTLVVALPEELFYRGYLQARLRDAWPAGRRIFGARLGKAFWVTAALFALGHLAIFQAWRLSVFFPALLFGWVRERTGTVLGATILHATFNLFELWLEASFLNRV